MRCPMLFGTLPVEVLRRALRRRVLMRKQSNYRAEPGRQQTNLTRITKQLWGCRGGARAEVYIHEPSKARTRRYPKAPRFRAPKDREKPQGAPRASARYSTITFYDVYIYIYIYIYTYTMYRICVYVYVYIYIYTHIYICAVDTRSRLRLAPKQKQTLARLASVGARGVAQLRQGLHGLERLGRRGHAALGRAPQALPRESMQRPGLCGQSLCQDPL